MHDTAAAAIVVVVVLVGHGIKGKIPHKPVTERKGTARVNLNNVIMYGEAGKVAERPQARCSTILFPAVPMATL